MKSLLTPDYSDTEYKQKSKTFKTSSLLLACAYMIVLNLKLESKPPSNYKERYLETLYIYILAFSYFYLSVILSSSN